MQRYWMKHGRHEPNDKGKWVKADEAEAEIERLAQTALNGVECSKCLRKADEPVCMYCGECYGNVIAEIERLLECRRVLVDVPAAIIGGAAAVAQFSGDDDALPDVVETAGWLKGRREAIEGGDDA